MSAFEKKLGPRFLSTVPTLPGVYFIYDSHGSLIYIGKAKNLRRRISNYKNAKRKKRHAKMRKIISHAECIKFEICNSEYEALILETKLIQVHRPKWNIAGAFSFLYPMIGVKYESENFMLCYTNQPASFNTYSLHGAYRSRKITRDAFFSLIRLLKYVGHPVKIKKDRGSHLPKYSYEFGFRRLSPQWVEIWELFWRGQSKKALELLILELVENAGARSNGKEIQKQLNILNRFWIHEASHLRKIITKLNYLSYPVSQLDRDIIFLNYKYRLTEIDLDTPNV